MQKWRINQIRIRIIRLFVFGMERFSSSKYTSHSTEHTARSINIYICSAEFKLIVKCIFDKKK